MRVVTALLLCILMMGLSFAGTTSAVTVSNLTEYETAINDSYKTTDAVIINFLVSTVIDLGSASIPVPSNVTVNLNGGTLRTSGTLAVSGSIAGGTVEILGGTLLRKSGSSITATISLSSGGMVRGPLTLSLENLSTVSVGYITSISYDGESGSDTYVNGNYPTDVIYTQMTGSNYSQYKIIDQVKTTSGYVFRLGTRNTSTLSLVYSISYDGLTGAKITAANPTSYTESDSAFTLTNPTKDGYTFVGWVCASLGLIVPDDNLTVAEGTSGDLTFTATWVEGTMQSGMSGSVSGGGLASATTDTDTALDAETAQAAAAASDTATTSTKRVKQASSSTKITFTSDVATVLPTVESVQGASFPWGWLFGGVAGAAVLAYVAALIARKLRENRS